MSRSSSLSPSISATVPVACARHTSNWKRRSRAAAYPCAKKRSYSVSA